MLRLGEISALLRGPGAFLEPRLGEPQGPRELFSGVVAPLMAVRSVAVLVPSFIAGRPLVGVVLALGNFVLQLGTWLGLALVLPTLCRQAQVTLPERGAFALATYALVPLWLAGALYVLPEDPAFVWLWSRALVLAVASYGAFVMYRGLAVLGIAGKVRTALTLGVTVASVTLYFTLFILLGISSHILLRLLD
ncbi:MAG: hypothetical protein HYZ27_11945 [Deltaproteobacteria bacterium]|nr:hypothetical protein [Deltaproteobacteria bacterium]